VREKALVEVPATRTGVLGDPNPVVRTSGVAPREEPGLKVPVKPVVGVPGKRPVAEYGSELSRTFRHCGELFFYQLEEWGEEID
jgi:hypothetical protein